MHIHHALCLLLAQALVTIAVSDAFAASILYQTQTGQLSAQGSHPDIGSSSSSLPISGLSDVDESVLAADSLGADAYEGAASLRSSLGVAQLTLEGSTSASVDGCDSFLDPDCFASSSADLDVLFELSEAALVQILAGQEPGTNNGPLVELTHLALGFRLGVGPLGGFEIASCGSLDMSACLALVDVFGPGAVLPGGSYQVAFDLFAFTPMGSCSVGCNDAGGSFSFGIIPEPGSGMLLSGGLVALAAWRRRRLR